MFDKIVNGCHKALIPVILSRVCASMYPVEDDGIWLFYSVMLLVYSIGEFVQGYRE